MNMQMKSLSEMAQLSWTGNIGTITLGQEAANEIFGAGERWTVTTTMPMDAYTPIRFFNCKHCGAVGQSGVCEYCGSAEE